MPRTLPRTIRAHVSDSLRANRKVIFKIRRQQAPCSNLVAALKATFTPTAKALLDEA